jgi:hypothetical protein
MKHLLLALFFASSAIAQIAPATTTRPSSLDTLRSTYAAEKKRLQTPYLQAYAKELQALSLRTTLSSAERAAVAAEITRVQGLVAGSGTFEPIAQPAPAPIVRGADARLAPGIMLTLEPATATPAPSITTGPDARVQLGSASWPVSKLPAGKYDVVIRCDGGAVPPGGKISLSIGTAVVEREIRPTAPAAIGRPRIIRLGSLQLKEDISASKVTLTASPAHSAWLSLIQAFITTPKP